MHWLEILKRLREEQDREYYKEDQRPALQLPLPTKAYYPIEKMRPKPSEEVERGVVIIDMYNID